MGGAAPRRAGQAGRAGARVVTPGGTGSIAGELLTMTQVARGLDANGLLVLDVLVNGAIPETLADAELQVQVWASPGVHGWGARMGRVRKSRTCCPQPPPGSQARFPSRAVAWPRT